MQVGTQHIHGSILRTVLPRDAPVPILDSQVGACGVSPVIKPGADQKSDHRKRLPAGLEENLFDIGAENCRTRKDQYMEGGARIETVE
jgi:hypothetical protein